MADRHPVVEDLLAHPPLVHVLIEDGERKPHVWSTADDCYDFLATRVRPGDRTLETGLGISTALFTLLGAEHYAVCSSGAEKDRLVSYLTERGLPHDKLTFLEGASDVILPTLKGTFDVYLIDGGHGFPFPMIDWYYGSNLLRDGGTLVMDDVGLRPVKEVVTYLKADPRWKLLVDNEKWVAFERVGQHPLREEWTNQPFYAHPPKAGLAARAVGKARSLVRGSAA